MDLGFALSGGGIRSAAFSVGVLKALYDRDYFSHVDVISSVSGGGYASFMLYRDFMESGGQRAFGAATFADDVFAATMCELESNANFYPNKEALKGLINRRAFASYEEAIVRAFGSDTNEHLPLNAARSIVTSGAAPYFILNASLEDSAEAVAHRFSRIVEFSPLFARNDWLGERRWDESAAIPRWSEVVATSGAAFAPLKHDLPNFSTRIPDPSIRLWDGGKTENLAAVALIRRGVKHIVLIDAEHDPEYRFEGYERLRHLLPSLGYSLSVPSIDFFLGSKDEAYPRTLVYSDSSVVTGQVRALTRDGTVGPVTSRVSYLKLSIPFDVQVRLVEDSPAYLSGMKYDEALEEAWRVTPNCTAQAPVGGGFAHKGIDYFIYGVTDYQNFMTTSKARRIMSRPPFKNFKKGGGRYEFPHTTTLDQSFYTDQMDAFVGLGYLMGSSMPRYIP